MWDRFKKVHPFWWFAIFFVAVNVLWLGPMLLGGRTLTAGIEAPPFELARVEGGDTIDLADLEGSTVLLVFWATWCDSCVAEIPVLTRIHEKYENRSVRVVGMNLEPESRGAVRGFLKARAVPYPNVMVDPVTANAYKVKILPTIYLVNREGEVCRGFTGTVGEGRLTRALEDCMK
jgi:thiol-disulfide isomerase/thioredoxin